jgi:ribosomal protein S18 acetylase RimI-like enzyme
MGMKTRDATAADIDFLADTFLRAMRPYITAARGSCDQVREDRQFRDQLRLGATRIILVDRASAGFFMTCEQGQDLELHTLCVTPEFQRRGLGTAAIRQIIAEARGCKRGVILSVLKTNDGARRLYQRLGFIIIDETTYHYRMRLDSP